MTYSYKINCFSNGDIEIVPTFKIDGFILPYIVSKYSFENVYSVRYFGFATETYSSFNDAVNKLRMLCETYEPRNDKLADIYNDKYDTND